MTAFRPLSDLSRALVGAANHVLDQETWATDRLRPHAGRVAALHIGKTTVRLAVGREGRLELAAPESTADVEIELPAEVFALLTRGGPEAVFASARLSGKADFAEAIGFVLRHARWDFEEDLSRILGDVAARRVVSGLRGLGTAVSGAAGNAMAALAEYGRHEMPALVARHEVEGFSQKVDALRSAAALLEDRLRLIERGTPDR